jgi:hypothetical protein
MICGGPGSSIAVGLAQAANGLARREFLPMPAKVAPAESGPANKYLAASGETENQAGAGNPPPQNGRSLDARSLIHAYRAMLRRGLAR